MSAATILQTRGLSKRYGRVEVLRGLDLEVRGGEIYGFLGRNGAGKTTTIRILMGIIGGDGGALELFGSKVARPTRAQKRDIGYVSQEQHFYPWMTCARLGRFVAGFYPTWDEREFQRLLHVLYLPADRKVGDLSHGMRAKLALALALAHRPRMLILDEPTAGLDPAARREFLEIISREGRTAERTTFFSSHIIAEVEQIADRVGILEQGQLRYEGPLAELAATVRRVIFPLDADQTSSVNVPPGFDVLSNDQPRDGRRSLVLSAPPAQWETTAIDGAIIEALSLEDIFLALTIGRVAEL